MKKLLYRINNWTISERTALIVNISLAVAMVLALIVLELTTNWPLLTMWP